MIGELTKNQIEDLLDNVLCTPKRCDWKGDKIQFCCTVHHESNPSCGINSNLCDENGQHLQVFHCFSCNESGTLSWLLYRSLPDKFKGLKDAEEFLKKRYGVSYTYTFLDGKIHIKGYEDSQVVKQERTVLSKLKLAPFKSGKETYQYFTDRGFTKSDIVEFKIGRDIENETVTIPVFFEDGELAGVIGRYIDPKRPKNMRYKVYDFNKGDVLFPLDKLEVENSTIICVESMLDVILMRKWGLYNVVATMGGGLTEKQADILASKCNTVLNLFDNDEGGERAFNISKKRLKSKGISILKPTYYPEFGKDPGEWGEIETLKIIKSASMTGIIPLF